MVARPQAQGSERAGLERRTLGKQLHTLTRSSTRAVHSLGGAGRVKRMMRAEGKHRGRHPGSSTNMGTSSTDVFQAPRTVLDA